MKRKKIYPQNLTKIFSDQNCNNVRRTVKWQIVAKCIQLTMIIFQKYFSVFLAFFGTFNPVTLPRKDQ